MLTNNLETCSETWNSKQETNKPFPEPRNYQSFYATLETTTKSGCGFYLKKGLKVQIKNRSRLYTSWWSQIVGWYC